MVVKTGRELAGLAVMTLTGGEKLGRVDDVVFDPSSGRITGFFIDRGGMFSKPKFLPAGDVKGLGDDALTLESETALLDGPSALTGELAAKTVENLPVLNPEGTVLGKIADIGVDTQTLTVPYLLLAAGILANALHGKPHLPLTSVQTIGADSVIVSNTYDPKTA
ncbi:MAG: PRC-barrel domain-containing protein [Janthinobacterium lividum]